MCRAGKRNMFPKHIFDGKTIIRQMVWIEGSKRNWQFDWGCLSLEESKYRLIIILKAKFVKSYLFLLAASLSAVAYLLQTLGFRWMIVHLWSLVTDGIKGRSLSLLNEWTSLREYARRSALKQLIWRYHFCSNGIEIDLSKRGTGRHPEPSKLFCSQQSWSAIAVACMEVQRMLRLRCSFTTWICHWQN